MRDKIHSIAKGIVGVSIMMIPLVIVGTLLLGKSSFRRELKSVASDWSGGLNRTVTVYDYEGDPIQSWSGKFDVTESENEVYFDVDGKRVIIHGGIVINEEEGA